MPTNKRPPEETDARIDTLLAAMTLAEKLGQLTLRTADLVSGPKASAVGTDEIRAGKVGTLLHLRDADRALEIQRVAVEESRLKIPVLFTGDVLHGQRTVFPIPLGEAAAFDPDLWQRTARCAAVEAAADGMALTFAPMLDVARDPRWGRIAESAGEDRWVTARFAEAKVRGFQGTSLADRRSVAATAKHLAGYGLVMAGREYAPVEVSERTFHEVYLAPFKAAVEAGSACLMPAFTDQAGVPMHGNARILRDVVRNAWGFEGVIVSDYGGIDELVPHGIAEDLAEAAAIALLAGIDIDLMGEAYARGLPAALKRGLVAETDIDRAVRRVLALKAALGLFDDPFGRGDPALFAQGPITEHRTLAREAAQKSIVLLTNRDDVLPLDPQPASLAVIGPLADAAAEMLGPWAMYAAPDHAVSLLAGIETAFEGTRIRHAPGCSIEGGDDTGIQAAVAAAREADRVILCLGEALQMSGEAASRGELGLPSHQSALARAVIDVGKPVVVVLSCGRPILEPWLFAVADAVLVTWFLGSEAGHAVADVLAGRCNPSGRLPVTWPVALGQVPIFMSRLPTGRPPRANEHYTAKYRDLPVDPLFFFGHGHSYSRFAATDLRVASQTIAPGQTLRITVDVTNHGRRAGEATLFLFSRDPVASISRPLLELRGIAKATLEPGETTTLAFALEAGDLAFLGPDLQPRLEPGAIDLLVGPSADPNHLLTTRIKLEGC
jgi:beta-glucosidase